MPAPENRLKRALAAGQMQCGVWLDLASPTVAEIASYAGFDWCVIDAEHGPSDIPLILAQLQAINGAPSVPVVRVPVGQPHLLKQVLDLGVQSVVVPLVEDARQAADLVRAVRYPPEGIRGAGAGVARASAYSGHSRYFGTANAEICLIVQAESRRAVENIDEIAATDGVDCVLVGPSDLAADLGVPEQLGAPEVQDAVAHLVSRTRAAGKAAGIFTLDPGDFARYAEMGVRFMAVGSDVVMLASAMRTLAQEARRATA